MQGGQRRDLVVLRMVLGIACVAVVGLIAAPAAIAGAPATDQYGSALPGGGNGGNTSGSGTTIPVAHDSSSSGQTATGGSSDSSGTKAKSTDTGSGSSRDGHKADAQKNKAGTGGGSDSANLSTSGHSVPQIATDSAGDSWLPFFIGGMVALACAAAALVFFRNRRRTAQG